MTKKGALDLLLSTERFLDVLEDQDILNYLKTMGGYTINGFSLEDVEYKDQIPLVLSTLEEIVTPQNIEEYKYFIGPAYYIYLAGQYKLDDIYLGDFAAKEVHIKGQQLGEDILPPCPTTNIGNIKNVHLQNENTDYRYMSYSPTISDYAVCDNLIVECADPCCGDSLYNTNWKTLSINSPLTYPKNFVVKSAQKLIYGPAAPADALPQIRIGSVEEIYLPNVNGVLVPKWIPAEFPDSVVYKAKGQKVQIFARYRDWYKSHIKSI